MNKRPFCACGCGKRVKGLRATYLKGHGTTAAYPCVCRLCEDLFAGARRNANRCSTCLRQPPTSLCACGCGKRTKGGIYVSGHNLRCGIPGRTCMGCGSTFTGGSGNSKRCKACRKRQLCACGCGKRVKTLGAKYKAGHNPQTYEKRKCSRCPRVFRPKTGNVKQCSECRAPKTCKCGCGQIVRTASQGSEYVRGHHPFYALNEHRAMRSLDCKAQFGRQSKAEKLLGEQLDKRIFKYTGLDNARGKGRYGQPISSDFTAKSVKLIVQVDGCYWHGCKQHGQSGMIGKEQRKRDRRLTRLAEEAGWTVLRIWEHDVKEDASREAKKALRVYRQLSR